MSDLQSSATWPLRGCGSTMLRTGLNLAEAEKAAYEERLTARFGGRTKITLV